MKTIILSAFLGFTFTLSPLQAQNQELLHKYHLLKGDVLLVQNGENKDKNVNPYYKDEFQEGIIYFPNIPPLEAVIRYDLLREEMQVLLKENSYQVLEDNVRVEIENVTFQKFNYLGDNKQINQGYFEIITEEGENKKLLLLKKYYKEKNSDLRSEARGFPARYADKSDYFLKFGQYSPAILVPVKIDEFVSYFDKYSPEVKVFIKNKKLKLRKEEDLVKVVDYYNSLTKEK